MAFIGIILPKSAFFAVIAFSFSHEPTPAFAIKANVFAIYATGITVLAGVSTAFTGDIVAFTADIAALTDVNRATGRRPGPDHGCGRPAAAIRNRHLRQGLLLITAYVSSQTLRGAPPV